MAAVAETHADADIVVRESLEQNQFPVRQQRTKQEGTDDESVLKDQSIERPLLSPSWQETCPVLPNSLFSLLSITTKVSKQILPTNARRLPLDQIELVL